MEFWLINVLKILKTVLDTRFSALLCVLLPILIAVCFIVELSYILLSKKSTSALFFKSGVLIILPFTTLFSLSNYCVGNAVFINVKEIIYYNALLLIVSYVLYLILKIACYFIIKANKKALLVLDKIEPMPPKTNVKKIVETITCKTFNEKCYSGYLDIDYCKQLIQKLKGVNLESIDDSKLEDFEVYLLNFVSRQPNESERDKVGDYLNWIIKTLAKYNIA